jgi:hypothetical protein
MCTHKFHEPYRGYVINELDLNHEADLTITPDRFTSIHILGISWPNQCFLDIYMFRGDGVSYKHFIFTPSYLPTQIHLLLCLRSYPAQCPFYMIKLLPHLCILHLQTCKYVKSTLQATQSIRACSIRCWQPLLSAQRTRVALWCVATNMLSPNKRAR